MVPARQEENLKPGSPIWQRRNSIASGTLGKYIEQIITLRKMIIGLLFDKMKMFYARIGCQELFNVLEINSGST